MRPLPVGTVVQLRLAIERRNLAAGSVGTVEAYDIRYDVYKVRFHEAEKRPRVVAVVSAMVKRA